jgi:hypothetical protein
MHQSVAADELSWNRFREERDYIRESTVRDVGQRLKQRLPGPRDQARDDLMFSPANASTVRALAAGDVRLPVEIISGALYLTASYEAEKQCEVHKGSLHFNQGVAYLACFDFVAALHAFEQAQEETRKTTGQPNWSLFHAPLFIGNVWKPIAESINRQRLRHYEDLWGCPVTLATITADWDKLGDDTRLAAIIGWQQWYRIVRIESRSRNHTTYSLAHARWALLSDLSIALETEVKRHAATPDTLWPMLRSGLPSGAGMNLRGRVQSLHARHGVRDFKGLEAAAPQLIADVETSTNSQETKLASAVYLFYATRNQVNHAHETSASSHRSATLPNQIASVLLSLLHVDPWIH